MTMPRGARVLSLSKFMGKLGRKVCVWGVGGVTSKKNRDTFASLCKNTGKKIRPQLVRHLLFWGRACLEGRGVREHFTVLLFNLCPETGSLFGPLYLLGPLAIYLGAQSAVCNITVSCCGDCDVNAPAFWL